MYSTSEEYKKQINEPRFHKIKGTVLPYGSKYEEDISSKLCGEISRYSQCTDNSESFGIGAVYQGELNFSLKKADLSGLYDAKVNLQFGLLLESGETEWIPLGIYYIKEAEKSGQTLKIKALDQMSELDIPTGLIKGQTYTFKTAMQTITEKTGVEFAQTFEEIEELSSLPLWQLFGTNTPATYRDILRSMAQLIGGFAYINRTGKIEFKRLDNTAPVTEIPAKRRHSLTLSEQKFEFGKLQYTSDNGTITTYTYIGNGATVYFENNGFIYSEGTLSQLEEIAENLKNVKYYSGTIEYSGNPALDIGDYVRVVGGDADGELMLIGSDNWIFRGVQTLIAPNTDSATGSSGGYYSGPAGADGKDGKNGKDGFSPTIEEYENTDNSYILKITDKNGSYNTPNLKSIPIMIFLDCDTKLTGNILECDFNVLSRETQNICFSGDLVLYSETLQNAEIQYFLDDTRLAFTPKISVNGYNTQHLNAFFSAELGEHNFKVTINTDIIEQVQGRIIGQNIILIEAKPTTADDYIYTIENDKVKLIFYKGAEKRIQIPSEIEGNPVTEIESTCFTNRDIKYAIIPDTVEKIY